MEILINALGYLASSLVFAAFYVKRIMTLRLIAIGSNVAFIAYATTAHLLPIFILHSLLLPLNIHRILELRRNLNILADGQADEKLIKKLLGPRWITRNEIVFRDGQTTWTVYLLQSDAHHPMRESQQVQGDGSIFKNEHHSDNIYILHQEKQTDQRQGTPCQLLGYDKACTVDTVL